jgi:Predicted solute binding protein
MKHRLVLALLTLACLAALIAIVSRPAPSAPAEHAAPLSHPPASPASAQPAPSSAPAPAIDTPRLSSELRSVLPSLSSAPADWRAYNPAHLTVSPAPGVSFEFERTDFKPGGPHGEFTVWTGRNLDNPGATLIGVAHDRGWTGTLSLPGAAEYRIDVSADSVSVTPKLRGQCDVVIAFSETPSSPVPLAADPTAATAAAEDTHVVDVLFFYGDDIVSRFGETNAQRSVELEAVSQIERSNQILLQSKVTNLQWRFLAAERVPTYAKPNNISDDLRLFAFSNNAVGQFAQSRIAALGADQAVLYITDRRTDSPNTGGIAYTPGNHSVVLIQADAQTTAHELAHNFGCHHDRRTDSVPDNNGRYYYGHRFTYRNRDSGTVMSYAPYSLPYFSNPEVQVDSSVLVSGTNEKLTLGVPADEVRAADNARYLRERAKSMADTRASADLPRITAQPRGTTVTAGQPFSLNVTATGSGLAYQWAKDGAAIPGATSATYSKSNSASTDAGSYTVTITNSAGRVVSDAANVSVTTPPPPSTPSPSPTSPPPSTNNSGGGGGGGGAPSLWFLAALALLTTLRQWRGSQHPRAD